MSLVYIGCGTDFQPVIKLQQIRKFIYIDSQPQSEFGWMEYDSKYFYRKYYLKNFKELLPPGFIKINIDRSYPDVYYNNMTDRTILHYYSLPFPWTNKIYNYLSKKDIDLLKFYISTSTHLAYIGHSPHKAILNLIPREFILVTNDNTFYPVNKKEAQEIKDDEPDIGYEFIEKPDLQKRIKQVIYLTKDKVKKVNNYEAFLRNIDLLRRIKQVL